MNDAKRNSTPSAIISDPPSLDEGLEADQLAGAQLAGLEEASQTASFDADSVGNSAALISICTIISRITGFLRTWSMAYALGATFLSSSYQIANNLPNMLYELVMGGMLTTAFLPVYMSLKKKSGKAAGEDYASNLMTLVVIALAILSVICMIFPSQIIFTQSFYSDQSTMGTASLFFQFFAIQIVFYGASSILSGLLNANRDYIWGAIAPVFNNVIVIIAFIAYAFIAPYQPEWAIYIIAVGSPLGVFVQMVIQIPGLRRCGIRLRPKLNLKDPALKETASIGIPAILITIFGFVTVSVANAASYSFADNGPSVIAYSRLWFTFPYSFLAIPVATAMFTELSNMQSENDTEGVVKGILNGSSQIFFLMIPMAMYLIVFAHPLVTLYHIGAFNEDAISQIALYLAVMAVALPFYGVNTYLQMAFSSIRKMLAFSVVTLIGSVAQVLIIAIAVGLYSEGFGATIEWIAVGTIAAYLLGDALSFVYLKRLYSGNGFTMMPIVRAWVHGIALGLAGALVGGLLFWLLDQFAHPIQGSLLLALIYVLISGALALVVTFGLAFWRNYPEAAFTNNLLRKVFKRKSGKTS